MSGLLFFIAPIPTCYVLYLYLKNSGDSIRGKFWNKVNIAVSGPFATYLILFCTYFIIFNNVDIGNFSSSPKSTWACKWEDEDWTFTFQPTSKNTFQISEYNESKEEQTYSNARGIKGESDLYLALNLGNTGAGFMNPSILAKGSFQRFEMDLSFYKLAGNNSVTSTQVQEVTIKRISYWLPFLLLIVLPILVTVLLEKLNVKRGGSGADAKTSSMTVKLAAPTIEYLIVLALVLYSYQLFPRVYFGDNKHTINEFKEEGFKGYYTARLFHNRDGLEHLDALVDAEIDLDEKVNIAGRVLTSFNNSYYPKGNNSCESEESSVLWNTIETSLWYEKGSCYIFAIYKTDDQRRGDDENEGIMFGTVKDNEIDLSFMDYLVESTKRFDHGRLQFNKKNSQGLTCNSMSLSSIQGVIRQAELYLNTGRHKESRDMLELQSIEMLKEVKTKSEEEKSILAELEALEKRIVRSDTLLGLPWPKIVESAENKTVNFYHYNEPGVARLIDNYLKPALKDSFQIELHSIPIRDTELVVNDILAGTHCGFLNNSIDMIWINGENFATLRDNRALYGPFVETLPNKEYIKDNEFLSVDFGYDTDGFECVWSENQFVIEYNSQKVTDVPRTVNEFYDWVIKNPGRATYPAPPNFTGTAFITHFFYNEVADPEMWRALKSEEVTEQVIREFKNECQKLWDRLNEMEEFLYDNGENRYPNRLEKVQSLLAKGEIDFAMSYQVGHSTRAVQEGKYPSEVRAYSFQDITLRNASYLAIPNTSGNKEAALVAINFLISPEAQQVKARPAIWGELPVYEIANDSIYANFDVAKSVGYSPLNSKLLPLLEEGWVENVKSK